MEKDGYLQGDFNMTVPEGAGAAEQTIAISPQLSQEQLRVVLRWGDNPRDIDSHIYGSTPDGKRF